MSEKKYPKRLRFKGTIDGVENPVFDLTELKDMKNRAKPKYYHSKTVSMIFQLWQVDKMIAMFEPVQDPEPKEYTESDMIAFAAAMREDWVRACDEINP